MINWKKKRKGHFCLTNDEQLLLDAGFSHVACINPPGLPLEIALQPATAKENIKACVKKQNV